MTRPTAFATCLTLALAAIAAAQQIDESIGDGVVRSFASPAAKANAEASVALIDDPAAIGAPPPGFGPLPEFSVLGGLQTVTVSVERGVNLYGTGFVAGPLERTGRRVEYYNLDNFAWNDASNRNYQTHPWILGVRPDGSAFGVLFDSTWASSLDAERPVVDGVIFQTEGPSPRVITINGGSPQDVVMKLSDLTGRPFMPPMWSIGYHQSKYSYTPQSYALSIAQEFRNRSIPADVIWFDIDYMDGFRNFTFNNSTFPDPAQLNAQLDAIGFQAVWMANCGIKVDGGYSAYNEMTALDLSVLASNQFSPFTGEVWPGLSVWPDFTMSATRDWWTGRIAEFASIGIDGIWNDMNEPAVFNVGSKTMPDDNWHRADTSLGGAGPHRRYHNIYGMQMSRATREGMLQAFPDRRPFVLTRAGYMGGQRYAAMWTGDNVANWYHVDVSIQNVLNIGMSGQPNSGPDIGGFNGDSGALMYARWMGIGAMLPFARGHYGFASIEREPWSYGTATEDTSRLALNRRYRLLNYLYTQFFTAHTTGLPVVRPLFFAEPDNPDLRQWDDGFLIGPGLLVAAATRFGAEPQVPPTRTPLYKFSFPQSASPGALPDSLDADLPDLYVLGGHIVVANEIVQHSRQLSSTRSESIELIVALDDNGTATGAFYEDAGDGFGYLDGDYTLQTFEAERNGGDIVIRQVSVEGDLPTLPRSITVRVLLGDENEATYTASSTTLPFTFSIPNPTPDTQPNPNLRDGRLIRDAFTRSNRLAKNDRPRFSEISQMRALYAVAGPAGLEIGIEGELAIDGTAIALFIDAMDGGQNVIDTSALNPPPGGLQQLTGARMDAGFAPDRMLFANAFDGNVYCDWVTLAAGSPGSKTYLGRQFVGSGDAVLTGGGNPDGIEVALGTAGHDAGSGFEILLPYAAIGEGVGPTNEIRILAATVKSWGAVTNQTLPKPDEFWPDVAPDFTQIPGTQAATVVRAVAPDITGDGVVDVRDLYAIHAAPSDINDDGAFDADDERTLARRIRAGEACDVSER